MQSNSTLSGNEIVGMAVVPDSLPISAAVVSFFKEREITFKSKKCFKDFNMQKCPTV
jgi:hypothetical protein